jgi:uncharacterized membrane protein (DUF2068 family)
MAIKKHSSRGLWMIAAFKLFKGLTLLAVGVGALKLLHRDVASEVERWINYLRVDPQNHYIQKLLTKVGLLDDRKLKELSIGTFFYSGLLITEGVGLALKKRWAEYLTIVSTALLLPLEIIEIIHRVDFTRIALFVINIAVVIYLVIEVRRKQGVE